MRTTLLPNSAWPFPAASAAVIWHRHRARHLLDRSALRGVLAEIEALGPDRVEVRRFTPPQITRIR
jgi:hypothetical protein